ncbi:hypothetical protein M427DRAFT_29557 [Gonapodya prolifera JEL478]|uniref:Paf1-domain-containing protein n=1 Tax=Gonapodya prolifera (strain JEL478) TaxID=1344416 RepID=A0A139AQ95_GONPJ|nr:hypothetical protein M427DRAFT_29557 [Gonapodya prolifera JEL478]|eukprot:KXS18655.1 hypothetical protein M427DRAFT_29557 [Gonapodya prolifera JEL478]
MQVPGAPAGAAVKPASGAGSVPAPSSVPNSAGQSRDRRSGSAHSLKKPGHPQELKQPPPGHNFAFRTKYKNNPPPLPFEPKLLKYPFDRDRLHRYIPSDLADNDQLEVWPQDHELGVPLNLFTLGVFERELKKAGTGLAFPRPRRPEELDPKDAALVGSLDQINALATSASVAVGGVIQPKPVGAAVVRPGNVSWLRKTQYISSDANKHLGYKAPQVEHGSAPSPALEDIPESELLSRLQTTVERSFDSVKNTDLSRLRHPTKPELRAVEAYPLVPDFENWAGYFVSCVYQDGDPLGAARMKSDMDDVRRETALLRPTGEAGSITQALYLPNDATAERLLQKRKRAEDGDDAMEEDAEPSEFAFVREYDYERLESQSHVRRLLVALRPQEGAAVYNVVKAHMLLKKARAKVREYYADGDDIRPAGYKLRRRNYTAEERESRRRKLEEIMEPEEAAEMVAEED